MNNLSIVVDPAGNDRLWVEEHHLSTMVGLFSEPHKWLKGRAALPDRKLSDHYFIAVMDPRSSGSEPPGGYARLTGIDGTGMLIVEARQTPLPAGSPNIDDLILNGTVSLPSGALLAISRIQNTKQSLVHLELPTKPSEYGVAAWHLALVTGSLGRLTQQYPQEMIRTVARNGTVVAPGPVQPRTSTHESGPTQGVRFIVEGSTNPLPPCLVTKGEEVISGPSPTYNHEIMVMKMYM